MKLLLAIGVIMTLIGKGGDACGQVVVYEGRTFPETEGWEHELAGTPGADRELVDGWLVENADLPDGWTTDTGDADFYRRPLSDFVGAPQFFIEWRVWTDTPPEVLQLWAVPVALVAGGQGAAFYHTTITSAVARLLRDLYLPIVFVDIDADVPHTYRIELETQRSYTWYIDGVVVESGIPQGAYPDPSSVIVWGVQRSYYDSISRWDYVRYGVIPVDGSGDYDSDGTVAKDDFYFFHECLTNDRLGIQGGPDNDAGPGCRFADFDSDGDVDLHDYYLMSQVFTAS